MLANELTTMQNGEAQPCISIVVPLPGTSSQGKKAALLSIEKTIQKAGDFLQNMYPTQAEKLQASLHELLDSFDNNYDPTAEGAGFYVSPVYSKLILFPFPVREKVQIAETFAIRELLYLEHYAINYLLLHINEKKVQCYKGSLNRLEEIRDHNFPRQFHDDYEYSRPAQSSSYGGYAGVKGFERDKTVIAASRLKSFYREADQALTSYLGELPLIIAGPKKDIACMQETTRHKKNIIASINGNYTNVTIKELQDRVWPVVKSWIDDKEHAAILDLIQKKGQHRAVDEIRNVWFAVKEGKAYKLLVEKDYACPAFVDNKTGKVHLKAPKSDHRIIMDLVDDIMKMVIKEGGEIIFMKNGALDEHGHIALITRS